MSKQFGAIYDPADRPVGRVGYRLRSMRLRDEIRRLEARVAALRDELARVEAVERRLGIQEG